MMQSQEYRDNPRMNQSTLKLILDGVDVFKDKVDSPREEPTDAQKLGLAVHTLILEPHKSSSIVTIPKIDKKTREGKIFEFLKEGKKIDFFPVSKKKPSPKNGKGLFYEVTDEEFDFAQEMLGKYSDILDKIDQYLVLDNDDYQNSLMMAESILKNSDAKMILESCTDFEKIYEFDYMNIGFKSQLDGLGYNFILDLKTTIIENKDHLIKNEIQKRRTHFQAATYRKAYIAKYYYLIFVRSIRPFTVFPVLLSDDLWDEGDRQLDEACYLYNWCLENNPKFIANNRLKTI